MSRDQPKLSSASGARTQATRRARTAGGAGVPSHHSPRPDRAVSRELGVNSPEWRPGACLPPRRRYPGPVGAELEAAAGTSDGLLHGASASPPDLLGRPRGQVCPPRPRPGGWGSARAVSGPSLRP